MGGHYRDFLITLNQGSVAHVFAARPFKTIRAHEYVIRRRPAVRNVTSPLVVSR
jgi:hypothetical protein